MIVIYLWITAAVCFTGDAGCFTGDENSSFFGWDEDLYKTGLSETLTIGGLAFKLIITPPACALRLTEDKFESHFSWICVVYLLGIGLSLFGSKFSWLLLPFNINVVFFFTFTFFIAMSDSFIRADLAEPIGLERVVNVPCVLLT